MGASAGRREGDASSSAQEEFPHLQHDREVRRLLQMYRVRSGALSHEHSLPTGRGGGPGGQVPQRVQTEGDAPAEGTSVGQILIF